MRLRFECGADAGGDLSSLSRFVGGAGTACASDIDGRRSRLAAVVRSERARAGHTEDCSGMGAVGWGSDPVNRERGRSPVPQSVVGLRTRRISAVRHKP